MWYPPTNNGSRQKGVVRLLSLWAKPPVRFHDFWKEGTLDALDDHEFLTKGSSNPLTTLQASTVIQHLSFYTLREGHWSAPNSALNSFGLVASPS